MTRVLQVNDFALSAGGAEVVVAQTVELLRGSGHEVDVFTAADLPDARLTPRRYIDNPVARLEAFQHDVVHLHNFYHLLSPGILATVADYKRRRRVRVVMTAHDFHLLCPNAGGTWFPRRAARRPVEGKLPPRWPYLLS